jgi:hypothetical protein
VSFAPSAAGVVHSKPGSIPLEPTITPGVDRIQSGAGWHLQSIDSKTPFT